ncbi:hypothetical protein HUU42_12160 [bacterium]|nr:hypothetical protein [bacterium]
MSNVFCMAVISDDPAEIRTIMETLDVDFISNRLLILPSPDEAVAYIENTGGFAGEELPDMIVFGKHMWDNHGLDLLLSIKNYKRLHKLPVVIFCGDSDTPEISNVDVCSNCHFVSRNQLSKLILTIQSFDAFWRSIHRVQNEEII